MEISLLQLDKRELGAVDSGDNGDGRRSARESKLHRAEALTLWS